MSEDNRRFLSLYKPLSTLTAVLPAPILDLALPGQQQKLIWLPCTQLNVAGNSPARKYEVGVRYNVVFEDDPAFYLFATASTVSRTSWAWAQSPPTGLAMWALGPSGTASAIAIAFHGTHMSESKIVL